MCYTVDMKNELQTAAFEAAKNMREHAYTPYSGFKVGAALADSSGTIFAGCNVENASYGATICAERHAVLRAIGDAYDAEFQLLVIVSDASPPAPPCALCLQVLAEFCTPELRVLLADLEGIRAEYTLSQLLPHPFNRKSLIEDAR